MPRVLVAVDHHDGVPAPHSLEALTAARALLPVDAAVLSPLDEAEGLELGAALPAFGAERLFAPSARLTDRLRELFVTPAVDLLATLLSDAEESGDPYAALVVPATFEGREIAGRLAVRLDTALLTDAAMLDRDSETGAISATKHVFAFTWETTAVAREGMLIVTLRPGVVKPAALGDGRNPIPVERVDAPASPGGAVRIVSRQERVLAESERPSVTQAKVIVSGGRGTRGDLGAVEDLADALGAAVGASRVAVDAGWLPHSAQIGQTGSVVAPELYVAAGISGAIQHRAGMSTSRRIVVINNDPEAPLFELADLGVVGDLFTVLPKAAAIVRQRREGGREA